MTGSNATLHMLCGKIAAGKSTLSARLGEAEKTIVVSEDRWIEQLYGPELKTLADYFERCERLRATLAPHLSVCCRLAFRSSWISTPTRSPQDDGCARCSRRPGLRINSISSTRPTRCAGRACTLAGPREATASATPSSIRSRASSCLRTKARASTSYDTATFSSAVVSRGRPRRDRFFISTLSFPLISIPNFYLPNWRAAGLHRGRRSSKVIS